MPSSYPEGVIVFFRILADNVLAKSIHPNGREVSLGQGEDAGLFCIFDEEGKLLGTYERDFVACILPLKTVGPANAPN